MGVYSVAGTVASVENGPALFRLRLILYASALNVAFHVSATELFPANAMRPVGLAGAVCGRFGKSA